MVKQNINVGSSEFAGDGESLRNALIKVNQNFEEVYENLENLTNNNSANSAWTDSQDRVFNAINWSSGQEITITATPFETSNAVTYDSRTESEYIYFVWDQEFIDNVWEGWNTLAGEGQSYSVSLDNGTTWIPVETSGYSGNTFFYFWIPNEFRETYSFSYNAEQPVIIKYNRGSNPEIWFDLSNAPVLENTIIGVDMSVLVEATIQGETAQTAKILRPNFRFANVVYNNNTGAGDVNQGVNIWSGSPFVEDNVRINIRKTTENDAGRIYANFNNGAIGTMTFYWNAKLYTITQT